MLQVCKKMSDWITPLIITSQTVFGGGGGAMLSVHP